MSLSYRFSHHLEMIHEIILLLLPALRATLTDLARAHDESVQANEKKSNRTTRITKVLEKHENKSQGA